MMRWAFLVSLIISLLALSVVGNEPSPGVTVTCGDYVIVVSIEKALYPSLEANRLRLYYSSSGGCQATQTSTHLYVNTSLQGCGTRFLETGDSLVFSNVVVQDSVPLQASGAGSGDDGSTAVITREHDFNLPFKCSYSRKKILSLQFVPEGTVEIPGVVGFGDITFTFDVYDTSSYSTPYANGEFPVEVALNDYLYFEYSVKSSAALVVFAETCKATPGPSFYSSPQYLLIDNGCPRDTTLEHDYDEVRDYQRFKFRAFRFFNNYESYYIHCELLACHVNSDSRCTQGCLSGSSRRKRREVQEEVRTSDSYLIKRGPLLIKEKPKESADTGKQSAAVIGSAAAAGGLALVAIIALAVLFVKYRIARLLLNRNKIGDLYAAQDEQMSRQNPYIQEDDMVENTDEI